MKLFHTVLLSLAVLALAGCGAKKQDASSPGAGAAQGASLFTSAAANEYVKNFTDFANELTAAYKAKDYVKVASLTPKIQEFSKKAETTLKELKDADVQKFNAWSSQAMDELLQAIAKAQTAK